MQIKSFENTYNLVEFNLYVDGAGAKCVRVVDLLFESSLDRFTDEVEKSFEKEFNVEIEGEIYSFEGYKVSEFYEVNGLLKVICEK